MKRTVTSIAINLLLMCTVQMTFAQNKSDSVSVKVSTLTESVKMLQSENEKLKKELNTLALSFNLLNTKVAGLQQQADSIRKTIENNAQQFSTEISKTAADTNSKIGKVNQSLTNDLGKKSLYGIIGILVAVLLTVLLYWLLKRKQETDKTDFIAQLSQTKSSIDEKLVAEFAKQADVMESLLKTLRELPVTASESGDLDHSLALKLSDEITLIERNISLMDAGTKGLKQLNRSISKLKDNLAANGYEIPELLGKPYNEGMKAIITNTIQDQNLEKDVELITKIVKPQVNYKDVMIQAAQIEVSVR